MKKIFLSAAVLAMMASACQNEAVVEQNDMQQSGQLITLEVKKNLASRTVLGEGNATHWSKGDQIYVCGDNGEVTGILTLDGNGGSSNGTFKGYIFGGTELDYVVFPVPQKGQINMANRQPGKLDAPMIGTVGDGNTSVSLKNVGAIVAFKADESYDVKAYANGKNMSSGSYTFDPQEGKLTYVPSQDINTLTPAYIPEGSELVYVPVATTLEANDGNEDEPLQNLNIDVVHEGNVISSAVIDEVIPGEIYGDDDTENTDALDIELIENEQEWYDAFANGGTYKLTKSFEVAGKVALKDGKTLTILGENNKLTFANGTTEGVTGRRAISIYNSNLTIKNLNVDVTAPGKDNNGNDTANGIYTEGGEEHEARLTLINCNMVADKNTFVQITEKTSAVIEGGNYSFNGEQGKTQYAVSVQEGAHAEINTTVNGGIFGGGLTINGATANIHGIRFEGGESNGQHGLHIWNSKVEYAENSKNLYVDDVYVQTKSEGSDAGYGSVVNGVTFEGGKNYGIETGFKGTMRELGDKIRELREQQKVEQ